MIDEARLRPPGEVPELASNLSWLRRNVPDGRGDLYTYKSLASEVRDVHGVEISWGHLAGLHRGEKTTIGAELLWALAQCYAVPLEFFWVVEVQREVRTAVARYGRLRAEVELRLHDSSSTP